MASSNPTSSSTCNAYLRDNLFGLATVVEDTSYVVYNLYLRRLRELQTGANSAHEATAAATLLSPQQLGDGQVEGEPPAVAKFTSSSRAGTPIGSSSPPPPPNLAATAALASAHFPIPCPPAVAMGAAGGGALASSHRAHSLLASTAGRRRRRSSASSTDCGVNVASHTAASTKVHKSGGVTVVSDGRAKGEPHDEEAAVGGLTGLALAGDKNNTSTSSPTAQQQLKQGNGDSSLPQQQQRQVDEEGKDSHEAAHVAMASSSMASPHTPFLPKSTLNPSTSAAAAAPPQHRARGTGFTAGGGLGKMGMGEVAPSASISLGFVLPYLRALLEAEQLPLSSVAQRTSRQRQAEALLLGCCPPPQKSSPSHSPSASSPPPAFPPSSRLRSSADAAAVAQLFTAAMSLAEHLQRLGGLLAEEVFGSPLPAAQPQRSALLALQQGVREGLAAVRRHKAELEEALNAVNTFVEAEDDICGDGAAVKEEKEKAVREKERGREPILEGAGAKGDARMEGTDTALDEDGDDEEQRAAAAADDEAVRTSIYDLTDQLYSDLITPRIAAAEAVLCSRMALASRTIEYSQYAAKAVHMALLVTAPLEPLQRLQQEGETAEGSGGRGASSSPLSLAKRAASICFAPMLRERCGGPSSTIQSASSFLPRPVALAMLTEEALDEADALLGEAQRVFDGEEGDAEGEREGDKGRMADPHPPPPHIAFGYASLTGRAERSAALVDSRRALNTLRVVQQEVPIASLRLMDAAMLLSSLFEAFAEGGEDGGGDNGGEQKGGGSVALSLLSVLADKADSGEIALLSATVTAAPSPSSLIACSPFLEQCCDTLLASGVHDAEMWLEDEARRRLKTFMGTRRAASEAKEAADRRQRSAASKTIGRTMSGSALRRKFSFDQQHASGAGGTSDDEEGPLRTPTRPNFERFPSASAATAGAAAGGNNSLASALKKDRTPPSSTSGVPHSALAKSPASASASALTAGGGNGHISSSSTPPASGARPYQQAADSAGANGGMGQRTISGHFSTPRKRQQIPSATAAGDRAAYGGRFVYSDDEDDDYGHGAANQRGHTIKGAHRKHKGGGGDSDDSDADSDVLEATSGSQPGGFALFPPRRGASGGGGGGGTALLGASAYLRQDEGLGSMGSLRGGGGGGPKGPETMEYLSARLDRLLATPTPQTADEASRLAGRLYEVLGRVNMFLRRAGMAKETRTTNAGKVVLAGVGEQHVVVAASAAAAPSAPASFASLSNLRGGGSSSALLLGASSSTNANGGASSAALVSAAIVSKVYLPHTTDEARGFGPAESALYERACLVYEQLAAQSAVRLEMEALLAMGDEAFYAACDERGMLSGLFARADECCVAEDDDCGEIGAVNGGGGEAGAPRARLRRRLDTLLVARIKAFHHSGEVRALTIPQRLTFTELMAGRLARFFPDILIAAPTPSASASAAVPTHKVSTPSSYGCEVSFLDDGDKVRISSDEEFADLMQMRRRAALEGIAEGAGALGASSVFGRSQISKSLASTAELKIELYLDPISAAPPLSAGAVAAPHRSRPQQNVAPPMDPSLLLQQQQQQQHNTGSLPGGGYNFSSLPPSFSPLRPSAPTSPSAGASPPSAVANARHQQYFPSAAGAGVGGTLDVRQQQQLLQQLGAVGHQQQQQQYVPSGRGAYQSASVEVQRIGLNEMIRRQEAEEAAAASAAQRRVGGGGGATAAELRFADALSGRDLSRVSLGANSHFHGGADGHTTMHAGSGSGAYNLGTVGTTDLTTFFDRKMAEKGLENPPPLPPQMTSQQQPHRPLAPHLPQQQAQPLSSPPSSPMSSQQHSAQAVRNMFLAMGRARKDEAVAPQPHSQPQPHSSSSSHPNTSAPSAAPPIVNSSVVVVDVSSPAQRRGWRVPPNPLLPAKGAATSGDLFVAQLGGSAAPSPSASPSPPHPHNNNSGVGGRYGRGVGGLTGSGATGTTRVVPTTHRPTPTTGGGPNTALSLSTVVIADLEGFGDGSDGEDDADDVEGLIGHPTWRRPQRPLTSADHVRAVMYGDANPHVGGASIGGGIGGPSLRFNGPMRKNGVPLPQQARPVQRSRPQSSSPSKGK